MSVLFDITSGWTGVLGPFTLKIGTTSTNGAAIALTGLTITPVIHNGSGTAVTAGGTVTPDPDQVNNKGKFTYAPAATDFVFAGSGNTMRESHSLKWQVIDGAGKKTFFPNGEADEVGVYRAV